MQAFSSLRGLMAMARATLLGPRTAPPTAELEELSKRPASGDVPSMQGDSAEANPEVLLRAFEYRGDVTLVLDDESRVEGYVADLDADQLQLWHRGQTTTERLALARIRRVEFSGRDTASGQSYATWLAKREQDASQKSANGADAG